MHTVCEDVIVIRVKKDGIAACCRALRSIVRDGHANADHVR